MPLTSKREIKVPLHPSGDQVEAQLENETLSGNAKRRAMALLGITQDLKHTCSRSFPPVLGRPAHQQNDSLPA